MTEHEVVQISPVLYRVGPYYVDLELGTCTCGSSYFREKPCKHIAQVRGDPVPLTQAQIRRIAKESADKVFS